jgi:hypothetical protein
MHVMDMEKQLFHTLVSLFDNLPDTSTAAGII